jgi:uncharacterized membrane protein
MKIKMTLVLTFIAVVSANLCLAQPSGHPAGVSWGQSVEGVRLLITMTNTIVNAGKSNLIVAVIENSSTNAIRIADTGGTMGFDILLTSSAGKSYHLSPKVDDFMRKTVTIKPGEQNSSAIPVTIGKNIEPGDYTLKATRFFYVKDDHFQLESNVLRVQIK